MANVFWTGESRKASHFSLEVGEVSQTSWKTQKATGSLKAEKKVFNALGEHGKVCVDFGYWGQLKCGDDCWLHTENTDDISMITVRGCLLSFTINSMWSAKTTRYSWEGMRKDQQTQSLVQNTAIPKPTGQKEYGRKILDFHMQQYESKWKPRTKTLKQSSSAQEQNLTKTG